MKPTLKAPGTKHLKLKYDEPLLKLAFKFNLRHYNEAFWHWCYITSEVKRHLARWCTLTPGRHRLDPAWCLRLNLNYDNLLSSFAFQFQLAPLQPGAIGACRA
jgi:hypothetical protein